MKKISLVVPCYNEAENISELYLRIKSVFKKINYTYEIIFVDNASIDNSQNIYNQIINQDENVKALIMSRNYGSSQPSFLAGLHACTGDSVVLIEGDIQDPPELIPQLIKKWEEGFDVVYGQRTKRKGSLFLRFFYTAFYRVFKWLSYLNIPLDSGDFSLLDKKVKDAIISMPEKDVFIRGLRAWVGFKQTAIPYTREKRAHGKTKINFFQNFTWAKKAIVNFSYKPLVFISNITIIAALATILAAVIYLYIYFKTEMPKGFATILLSMFLFGTIQLFALSVIGEYLIRIFQEVKGRPSYIIAKVLEKKSKLKKIK